MKHFFTLVLMISTCLITRSYAQNINFNDPIFKCALLNNRTAIVDSSGDGEISINEAKNITRLDLYGQNVENWCGGTITNLSGIEHFTNLTSLVAPDNNIVSADLSQNLKLSNINLRVNNLASIEIGNNNVLNYLKLSDNQLTTIDVSKNITLPYLELNNNRITSIDLSNNILLEDLYLQHNLITNLDARNCSLKSLRIDNNPNIEWAYLTGQPFMTESFEGAPSRITFDTVKLDNCPNLEFICIDQVYINEAEIRKLQPNHSNYTVSTSCDYANTCEIINFTDPNFKNALLNYEYGVIDTNGDDEICIDEAEAITSLNIFNEDYNISSLNGIEYFTNLELINIQLQNIQHYDFSNNKKLKYLYLPYNNLVVESIDVSNNYELVRLVIYNTNFEEIDITNNIKLEVFNFESRELKELDLSENLMLTSTSLRIENAPISEIDISNNPLLRSLEIRDGNNIDNIDASYSSNLDYVRISSTTLHTLNVSTNSLKDLSLSCTSLETLYMKGDHEFYYFENYTNQPNDQVALNIQNCPSLQLICIDDIDGFNEFESYINNTLGYTNCVVTNNNDCSEDTNASNKYFTLSPNPAIHTINLIRLDNDITIRTAGIYTLSGVLIKKVPISFNDGVIPFTNLTTSLNPSNLLSGANSAFIDISDLLSGQYILYTPTNFGKFYTNFIKL